MDHPNAIRDPAFFLGGSAIFTVDNGAAGGKHRRYTYYIEKREFSTGEIFFFVRYLTGPDNSNWQSYSYLGMLDRETMTVEPTTKSKLSAAGPVFRAVNWAIQTVVQGDLPPAKALIIHEGRCCMCGRRLTTTVSITAGIGPECNAKLRRSRAKRKKARKARGSTAVEQRLF